MNIKMPNLPPSARSQAPNRVILNLPENPDFQRKFDPNVFTNVLKRVTRTIVVNQDPAPGDYAPSGTSVTVTVVEKSLIPTKSFPAVAQNVADKYPTIAALEDDLGNTGDPLAVNAKTALDKGVPFNQLAASDQAAVQTFTDQRLGKQAPASTAAGDIAFLYQL